MENVKENKTVLYLVLGLLFVLILFMFVSFSEIASPVENSREIVSIY